VRICASKDHSYVLSINSEIRESVLLLGTGRRPDASESENQLVPKLIMEGHEYIFENQQIAGNDFVANTIEAFHVREDNGILFPN